MWIIILYIYLIHAFLNDYILIVSFIYNRSENQVLVSVSVKYLDQQTKAMQVSQFDLVLEKDGNWKIVK
ncbi:conjugal transfer protein [Clostridium sporogenes]|uniref:conjugal transfer protein n=1 Tax=Clostridium sporogenes TaxID=1509 RepID=UPI003DA626DB